MVQISEKIDNFNMLDRGVILLILSVRVIAVKTVDKQGLIDVLYSIYKDDSFSAFKKYPLDIYNPVPGPYYRKLTKLEEPEALHVAVNGFISGNVKGSPIPSYPPMEKGKVFIYKVSGESFYISECPACAVP